LPHRRIAVRSRARRWLRGAICRTTSCSSRSSALDIRDGFWGLLANGASFSSVPGRRPTRPGRELARTHHASLMAVEGVVNGHYQAWRRGDPTPVGASLDVMYARWLALAEGERLVLEWPVSRLPETASRTARPRAGRRARPRVEARASA